MSNVTHFRRVSVGQMALGVVLPVVVTGSDSYALRLANSWVADRPAGGWPPEGRIFVVSRRSSVCSSFGACLIMGYNFFFLTLSF
jgi:hypothetical protein